MSFDLARLLEERRRWVDEHLRQALELLAPAPPVLKQALSYCLLAPGKRLRPILVILAAEACGGNTAAALAAASSVEMVHAYSLVHDDLPAMDDDDLRRGQPTCHRQFGEALAILTGDALLTLAFELLATSYAPKTATACCRELAAAAGGGGMVGGQVEDLLWEGKISGRQASCTLNDLEQVHTRKTGALLSASLQLGQWVAQGELPAGPDPDVTRCFANFGRCFGLLFQITDDLLDASGDAVVTGKRVGKDQSKGKATYPGLLGLEESRRFASALATQTERAIEPLGDAGAPLAALARMIVARDR